MEYYPIMVVVAAMRIRAEYMPLVEQEPLRVVFMGAAMVVRVLDLREQQAMEVRHRFALCLAAVTAKVALILRFFHLHRGCQELS